MLIQSFSQYVQFWESMGVEPLKIIEKYLVESKQEQAALEMIPRLAESQTNRVQRQLDYARTWIPIKVDTFACNKGLTHEQAQMLNTLTDYYCLGLELSEDYLEKVRVAIPQIKKPLLVFVPMVEWLKETYGIKFKGEK